ncbi:MAG: hypothetical protein ABIH23_01545 [bacterium]
MDTQTASDSIVDGNYHDAEYDGYLARINARFVATANEAHSLFSTNASDLWGVYLGSFDDPVERQYHNCHACRQFIERFGGLVVINEDGMTSSAIWHKDDALEAYKGTVAAMIRAVKRAKVTGVFLSPDQVWGSPMTGIWRHFAVTPPRCIVHKRALLTAGQAMAEKREEFKAVVRALVEFTSGHLETAVTLLKTDALYRTEKVLGQAEWLHALKNAWTNAPNGRKSNIAWRAIASAPAGFCHPRASMIGTLLEDIAAGKSYDSVSRSFAMKMHPLSYQRPQAAPTAGAIAHAERIIGELKAAGSLERRFARLDEVTALWRPKQIEKTAPPHGSVFGHLKPKGSEEAPRLHIPAQMMTWDKFQRTILPTAERIALLAPHVGSYMALVTAVNKDAPPILQWDHEDNRNPVSWYFWNRGAMAEQFGITADRYVDVEAVAYQPSMWNGGSEHHGCGVVFILAGARETRQSGAALFPEILKTEFHGIRSVIEAYSRNAEIQGMDEPHAAGIGFTKSGGNAWPARIRVWSDGRSQDYNLDRWD